MATKYSNGVVLILWLCDCVVVNRNDRKFDFSTQDGFVFCCSIVSAKNSDNIVFDDLWFCIEGQIDNIATYRNSGSMIPNLLNNFADKQKQCPTFELPKHRFAIIKFLGVSIRRFHFLLGAPQCGHIFANAAISFSQVLHTINFAMRFFSLIDNCAA
ncbi:MAG: hypothetical protein HYU79_00255 [Nitrosomonadales bacterium]|nr:hypothetical protein [Nitrosomonadales bacterium]